MSKSVYLSPSIQEGNIGYGDYGTEEERMNEVINASTIIIPPTFGWRFIIC